MNHTQMMPMAMFASLPAITAVVGVRPGKVYRTLFEQRRVTRPYQQFEKDAVRGREVRRKKT